MRIISYRKGAAVTAGNMWSDPTGPEWAAIEERREKLIRLADSILRNRHEAEDVVQETMVAVWTRIARGTPKNLEAYVRRAVYLNALKHRARRRGFVPLEEAPASALADPRQRDPADEEPFYVGPIELEAALRELPEAQQSVIRMKYYLGFSFREIGAALSISKNTVASRCRYAREALRRLLLRK
jgi:RNA polymerase sigma-70 factor (ECF subfamily)